MDLKKDYWDIQYAEPDSMDGIANVKDHSRYLAAFFNLEGVPVKSVVDLGFGTGHLFKEVVRTFRPKRALGLEPSAYIYRRFRAPAGTRTLHTDISSWCRTSTRATFDLGLCTSVLQYLSDKEIRASVPVLARRIRYLYLTVPTDVEYRRQKSELAFTDPYALVRSREQYQKLLRPHFTFLSTRILESKFFYNEHTTPFSDLLFRF